METQQGIVKWRELSKNNGGHPWQEKQCLSRTRNERCEMGGRGAASNLGFYRDRHGRMVAYGSEFRCILQYRRMKFVELRSQVEKPRVPIETRTPKRIYVLVGRKGELKAVTFYDSNGRRRLQIDLDHEHNGFKPHRHQGYGHGEGDDLRPSEKRLVKIIERIWRRHNESK